MTSASIDQKNPPAGSGLKRPQHLIVVGMVRDCASSLDAVFGLCDDISNIYASSLFIFVENGSLDKSREILDEWKSNRDDCLILTPPDKIETLQRTERLAFCRNMAMERIRSTALAADMMIVLDADIKLSNVSSFVRAVDFISSSKKCVAVFPNSTPVYYDVYALRHPFWCPRDVWREVEERSDITNPEAVFVHSRQVHIGIDAAPIKVNSAFGGMAIYRMPDCIGGTYVGSSDSGEEVCEHVGFNKNLKGDLFILPFWVVEAPTEHLSPSFKGKEESSALSADRKLFGSVSTISYLSKIPHFLMRKIFDYKNHKNANKTSKNNLKSNDAINKSKEINTNTKIHRIDSYDIKLPLNHSLPIYQSEHPLYDKFLPILAGYLPSDKDSYIVDVGANVGDTVAAMLSRCVQRFICIEGYDPYFAILQQNINEELKCPDRILPINAMIGTGRYSGSLQGDGSTATIGLNTTLGSAGIDTFQSLDSVVLSLGALDKVTLVKIDTDGFDGDVISSAQKILSSSEPLVFWENQFSDASQEAMLQKAYAQMKTLGYIHLWVFDNFGNPILCDCDFDKLLMINKYIEMQKDKKATRTIHYTDVLACKSGDVILVKRAISAYLQAASPKL